MTENPSNLSRRTLAKGAAWAVPAVAVAAAAPMVAASPCLDYSFSGANACKSPGAGNRDYHLVLKICNTCKTGSSTVNVTVSQLKVNNGAILTPCAGSSLPFAISETIEVGKCAEVDLGWFNSSQGNPNTISAYDDNGTLLFSASAPPSQTECNCPA